MKVKNDEDFLSKIMEKLEGKLKSLCKSSDSLVVKRAEELLVGEPQDFLNRVSTAIIFNLRFLFIAGHLVRPYFSYFYADRFYFPGQIKILLLFTCIRRLWKIKDLC